MGYDETINIYARLTENVTRQLDEIDRKFKALQKYGVQTSDWFVKMHGEERVKKTQKELEKDGVKNIYVKFLKDKQVDYNWLRRQKVAQKEASRATSMMRGPFIDAIMTDLRNDWSKSRKEWSRARIAKRRLGRAIDFIIPRYGQLLRIFAALVPLLIVLGVSALGVAAAFGAVAIAGASVIGLGLIGEGDSIAQAFNNARVKLAAFKREMFFVFQPTAGAFAPISDRFLESAPETLQRVAAAMMGLRSFDGTIFDAFDGLADFARDLFDVMVEYEPMISQVAMAFGKAIGETILKFLRFITEEAYNNQEVMMELGKTFATILSAIYNFSLVFSKVIIAMTPLLEILEAITELMMNGFAVGIAVAIAGIFMLTKAVVALQVHFATLWATIVGTKAALVGLVGGGVLLSLVAGVGAGLAVNSMTGDARTPATMPSGPSNYQIIVEGDMTDKNRREIETMISEQDSDSFNREFYMSR